MKNIKHKRVVINGWWRHLCGDETYQTTDLAPQCCYTDKKLVTCSKCRRLLIKRKKGIKMHATLNFNLPEEQDDFEMACKASEYYCALEEIRNFLRQKMKYENLTNDRYEAYREMQEEFHEIVEGLLK